MAGSNKGLGSHEMRLYHLNGVRSTRVTWMLHELDVADKVKIEKLNLVKGEQNKAEFLVINRMGTIPTLTVQEKDGDKSMVMTESSGICMWLADMVPEGGLKPRCENVYGLGQYYRFITFAASSMDPVLWDIRLHEQVYAQGKRVQDIADTARKTFLERIVPVLEDVFNSGDNVEFICEPFHKGFSGADIVVGYGLYWATMYGLLDESPILQEYLGRLTERKGFSNAMGGRKSSNL